MNQVPSVAPHNPNPKPSNDFDYDDLGNRTGSNTLRDGAVSYVVDSGSGTDNMNRYTSIGGNTISYDAAGNITGDENGYIYSYDYENRLIEITDGTNTIVEYDYDALGRRIKKTDYTLAVNTTLYYHNNNWQVLEEYNSTDAIQRYFVYGNRVDEAKASNRAWPQVV